ncbi:MAG: 2-C-methyl-D-erythritol 4-phosphate cytidylyltransferase [Opitutaceae bacterium]
MPTTAILLAAGSGHRMQGSVEDKILAPLNGEPIFLHSIRAFLEAEIVDQFTIVYRDDAQRVALSEALSQLDLQHVSITWTIGGKERQDSVYNALDLQSEDCDYVFIHDCARPLISSCALRALNQAVRADNAAVLAHPVIDTIKRTPIDGSTRQIELEDLERNRLWAMETPQAFDYAQIFNAYKNVRAKGLAITDDTAAAATIGLNTTLVPNDRPNPKITTPADLQYAEWLCRQ